ncbi:MAG: 4Fe-4S dicluster domain-containing protein [Desulforudis sp.]|nr:MAG: 4Fe-4S dicluster domain-containing protein [Desulforudis sp.]
MKSRKIVLRFPATLAEQPLIYYLVKDYDLVINIIKANINPHKEGTLIMELSGANYEQGIEYIRSRGVQVQFLTEEIVRNDDRCISCGACTAVCPSGALHIERPDMQVVFDGEQCIVCQLCTKVCPLKAMEAKF